MSIGIILKLVGTKRILDFMTSKDTVSKPAQGGIKKLALQAKAQLIKATVVGPKPTGTGHARSNIAAAPIQYAAFTALVTHSSGPGVKYIPYLETGTSKMDARHMEGATKVIGKDKGMFTYVRTWLKGKVGDASKQMAKDIEKEL